MTLFMLQIRCYSFSICFWFFSEKKSLFMQFKEKTLKNNFKELFTCMEHAIFVLIIIFNIIASTPIHFCKIYKNYYTLLHNHTLVEFLINCSHLIALCATSSTSQETRDLHLNLSLQLLIQRLVVTHSLLYQFANWCQSLHSNALSSNANDNAQKENYSL